MSDHRGAELTEERKAFLIQDYRQGFIEYCGFEAVDMGPGRLTAQVEISPNHRQQDGFIHAGVMSTLADHTAGYASYTLIPEDSRILTIEFKINFLRPAFGRSLVCRSRVLKPGRRVLAAESEVFDRRDGQEYLAAKALLTMAAVPVRELGRG